MPGPGSYLIGEEEKRETLDLFEGGYLFRYGDMSDPAFKHKVYDLERAFAERCGAKHCVATNSGTTALLCALKAAGVEQGDEVIVPAYTFVASYTAIIFAGGVPVLAEIDESLTVDPEDIEARVTPKTRAVMPVHMLGNASDMDAIADLAQRKGIRLIEDCCQALGASYHGRAVGTMGDAGCFSLNVFKTITAGDGGLLITDDEETYELAFGFHDQGHSPNRASVEVGRRSILGLDFRMTELAGAVALAQLRKLDGLLALLREKKALLRDAIGDVPGARWRVLPDPEGECGTLLTVIFDDPARAASVADALGATTVDHSGWHVYSNMEHIQAHMEKLGRPCPKGSFPRTDDILSRAINISVGVVDAGLGAGFGVNIKSTDAEIAQTAETFRKACGLM